MVENNKIVFLTSLQVVLVLLPLNHIGQAQQPAIYPLKIGDKDFLIQYTIVESKVFGNFSKGLINNNVSLTKALLGKITHIDADTSGSKLIITTQSSIAIALTLDIPTTLKTALTNLQTALNQNTSPVSVDGNQAYALVCPRTFVTKVFIPYISSNSHIITVSLNPNIFRPSPSQTCSGIS